MNSFFEALERDVTSDYEHAVQAYSYVIKHDNAPVEGFINLSFIYWEAATQTSFTNGTPIEVLSESNTWAKCFDIVELGLLSYPNDLELSFWKRYYMYRGVFDDFSQNDCLELMKKCTNHNNTVVPFFFLSLFDEIQYSKQKNELLNNCQKLTIAKNNWIYSILTARNYLY